MGRRKIICMVIAGIIFCAFLKGGNAAPAVKSPTAAVKIKKAPAVSIPPLKITKPETAPVLTDPGDFVASGEQRNVTWTAVASASSYDFQWASNNMFTQAVTFECQSTISGFKQSVQNNPVVYYMRVRARNADGSGPWSNVVDLTVLPGPAPEAPPPAPVATLTPVSASSDQTYTLSWTMLDGPGWYEYLEAQDPQFIEGCYDCSGGGNIGSSKDFHHEVTKPQKYYYRVRASRTDKDPSKKHPASEWSKTVEITISPRN
jgi:predicted phage tail protein